MLWLLLAACVRSGAPGSAADPAYTIDGRAVSAGEWERAVSALDGPQRGWTCAETTDGGIVEWYQRDGGRWVRVEEVSGGVSSHSLVHVPDAEVPAHLREEP